MNEMQEEKYISISEMGKIHNLSRQTLLHYDHIGLFKPTFIKDNGYRFYSRFQIPFLREICFLKSLGFDLTTIKKHFEKRNIEEITKLLEQRKDSLDKEICNLNKMRMNIQQRLNLYSPVSDFEEVKQKIGKPFQKRFPQRKILFMPLEQPVVKKCLHMAIMNAWKILAEYEMLPSSGFGTIILQDSLSGENVLAGAGSYIALPYADTTMPNIRNLPAGEYICMYKYGMPYDTKDLYFLLEWIETNDLLITGDVVDACILDTTFYSQDNNVDLCMLQIPVQKKVRSSKKN